MDRIAPSPQTTLRGTDTDAEPERIVVWAFRHWICGHVEVRAAHWSMVCQRLNELCGSADGTRAVTALEGMVRAICRHAGRSIHYHQPHCPCFGDDERTLIELIASCQQRQWLNAASWARGLVGEDGVGDLIEAASRLASVLAQHGQLMPGNFQPPHQVETAEPTTAEPVDRLH